MSLASLARPHKGGVALLLGTIAGAFALPFLTAAAPDALPAPAAEARPLDALGATSWHSAGQRGKGLKVAVLDTGFVGYRKFLGSVLPLRVESKSFRHDGDLEAGISQHGILCGEVIHAVAPEAELLFANWEPERSDQFLAAVRWARARGARIISCSVITPAWSDYEGHGPIHAELTQAVGSPKGPGAVLFFACAGNIAQRHWAGAFEDDGHDWHNWQPGAAPVRDNPIQPWGTERVSVELSYHRGAFEVAVVDPDTKEIVRSGRGPIATSAEPLPHAVVNFMPQAGTQYAIRVHRLHPRSGPFHVAVLGGGLERSSAQGSIPFPGDGAEVVTVGAVDSDGLRCRYSSCGEEHSGKPDLVAVVPFPSTWRRRPFGGTSAAAPQAAALAALVWARHPEWTVAQVRDALRREAIQPATPAAPWETGAGCLHLADIGGRADR